MIPRHQDPKRDDRRANAPFNFVPLPDAVFYPQAEGSSSALADYSCFDMQRYTGTIDLEITTETPLYIRCGIPAELSDACEDRCHPAWRNFFHRGNPDQPVIPGSSLRGMTRSLVEVLSFGKMQWFTNKRLIFRAVGDESSLGRNYRTRMRRIEAGYLLKDGHEYAIRPAKREFGVSFIGIRYDTLDAIGLRNDASCSPVEVYIDKRSIGRGRRIPVARTVYKSEHPDTIHVRLALSGHIDGKRTHYAVFDPDPTGKLVRIPQEVWELFEDDLRTHRSELAKDILDNRAALSSGKVPVFYLISNDELEFFGLTMMFRVPYDHSIADFVPEELRDPARLDLAEMLFGTVTRTPDQTRALQVRGRVMFEDAIWVGLSERGLPLNEQARPARFEQEVSPRILSAPKPTAFQEYLTQSQPDDVKSLNHYGSDPQHTAIRGHKYYWHKRFDRAKYWEPSIVSDSTHTVMRPLKAGNVFRGKVKFENLTELELGALLTALQLPEQMRHKLGMGKPLAMGTVRIAATLQILDLGRRYSALFAADGGFESGQVPQTQAREVARRARAAFEAAIVAHYNLNRAADDPIASDGSLWDIPRLADLKRILTWENGRSGRQFDYPAPAPNGGIDGTYWRKRRVVPTPSGVLTASTDRRLPSGSSLASRR